MRPAIPRSALASSAVALALLAPATSEAAPPRTPNAAARRAEPAPKPEVAALLARLRSGDEAQVRGALDELRIAAAEAPPAAAPAIAEVLGRGLTLASTLQAIETLGDLESEAGSPVLADYAGHRAVDVRRAAVKALTRTRGPAATKALRRALADSDASVRSTAAAGLGALGAKDAVPELFLALEHRVNEAAVSIGQLCDPVQCAALADKLGKLPFDVVTSGLEPALVRVDLSDDAKIALVGRVRDLHTGEAHRFLSGAQQRLPKNASARVRQALEDAVRATRGGSQ